MRYNIKITQTLDSGINTICGAVDGVAKEEALDRLDLLFDVLGGVFPGMFPNTSIVVEIKE